MAADRPAEPLRLTIDARGDWTRIRLAGDLDFTTVGRLHRCLEQLLKRARPRVALELSALEFCDSMGIRCLIEAWKRAQQAGGKLVLLRPHPHVRDTLSIMGLDRFLSSVDELPDAGAPRRGEEARLRVRRTDAVSRVIHHPIGTAEGTGTPTAPA